MEGDEYLCPWTVVELFTKLNVNTKCTYICICFNVTKMYLTAYFMIIFVNMKDYRINRIYRQYTIHRFWASIKYICMSLQDRKKSEPWQAFLVCFAESANTFDIY